MLSDCSKRIRACVNDAQLATLRGPPTKTKEKTRGSFLQPSSQVRNRLQGPGALATWKPTSELKNPQRDGDHPGSVGAEWVKKNRNWGKNVRQVRVSFFDCPQANFFLGAGIFLFRGSILRSTCKIYNGHAEWTSSLLGKVQPRLRTREAKLSSLIEIGL